MADFVAASRDVTQRKARQNRIIFIALGIILTVLIGESIFQFLLAPNMRIENIIIDNEAPPLRRDDLLSAAGLQGQHYYFRIDVEAIRSRIEALPAVKSAWVQKIFPASLRIVTRGRQPLAFAFADGEGTVPLVFDEEGVVFLAGNDVPEAGLPVLSGIRFEGFRVGMRLPDMLKPFLTDIMKLQKTSPSLLSAFSEMKIVRKGDEQFEVVLYPVYHRVPVRIEGTLSAERCKAILVVLDALGQEGMLNSLEELDFRTEDIIYRFKEG
ncbi:MAG: FtsQ-type POTRA domain-containing protein [Spirochaetales bacterium]|jgi:cell division septal protein FtsQ|nr:FtsQ-type POTRA domain-containing protein [Spirochaetales bacterium]